MKLFVFFFIILNIFNEMVYLNVSREEKTKFTKKERKRGIMLQNMNSSLVIEGTLLKYISFVKTVLSQATVISYFTIVFWNKLLLYFLYKKFVVLFCSYSSWK